MANLPLSPADRRILWSTLRTPVITMLALLLMLGLIVLLGVWRPFQAAWMIEAAVTVVMLGTVIVASMELMQEPPIIRFFSLIGFFWVAILFAMTLLDYVTR